MRRPLTATIVIAGVTAAAWLLTAAAGASDIAAMNLGMVPARMSGLMPPGAVPAFLTPLTATLVHAGVLHLLFNTIMMLWCGTGVERGLGKGALAALYVAGAIGAALAQWAVDPASTIPMIGASGAISAVMGAFALSYGEPKRIVKSHGLNRAINALWLLVAWAVLQLMIGFASGMQGVLVATAAHVGGFLVGLLLQRPLLLWRYRSA